MKKENLLFDQYMRSLSTSERNVVLRDICEACGVSTNVVYFWRVGRSRLKRVYMDKITEIVGKNIFSNVDN